MQKAIFKESGAGIELSSNSAKAMYCFGMHGNGRGETLIARKAGGDQINAMRRGKRATREGEEDVTFLVRWWKARGNW